MKYKIIADTVDEAKAAVPEGMEAFNFIDEDKDYQRRSTVTIEVNNKEDLLKVRNLFLTNNDVEVEASEGKEILIGTDNTPGLFEWLDNNNLWAIGDPTYEDWQVVVDVPEDTDIQNLLDNVIPEGLALLVDHKNVRYVLGGTPSNKVGHVEAVINGDINLKGLKSMGFSVVKDECEETGFISIKATKQTPIKDISEGLVYAKYLEDKLRTIYPHSCCSVFVYCENTIAYR